jgi:hypothetical protein
MKIKTTTEIHEWADAEYEVRRKQTDDVWYKTDYDEKVASRKWVAVDDVIKEIMGKAAFGNPNDREEIMKSLQPHHPSISAKHKGDDKKCVQFMEKMQTA